MASAPADRLHALDLLRFVAALSVALSHWYWVTPSEIRDIPIYPEQLFRYGGLLGVIFFFVASGFVILRSAQDATPLRFAASRVIRLYPAFWVCCTITFLLIDPWLYGWRDYLLSLTMFPEALGAIPVDEAYWTLALEAGFYLLIWLLLLTRSLKRIEVFLWSWLVYTQLPDFVPFRELIASSPDAVCLAEFLFDMKNGGRSFSTYAPFFIGGCVCFLLADKMTIGRSLLFGAAVMACGFEAVELATRTATFYQFRPVAAVTGISVAFFFVVLAISKHWIRLPASRLVTMLGAMSYPIYLLNMHVGSLFLSGLQQSLPFPLAFALVLAGVMGLSWCVVVHAEAPMQAWMRARLRQWQGSRDGSSGGQGGGFQEQVSGHVAGS
jgi:peptidoglycan/LPS O-acetylase OafA/YrhL